MRVVNDSMVVPSPFDENGSWVILGHPLGLGDGFFSRRTAAVEHEIFEYVIDANDVITHVNPSWKAFAEENDGGDLAHRVVGSWLWQHLAGMEVKNLFRVLLERVREAQESVRVPFRCDAPDLRRDMMLEVTPLSDGGLRFSSWTVKASGRPPVLLLDAKRVSDPDRMLSMCAWCKRIRGGSESWLELEEAVSELGLFRSGPLPKITHGVCRDCRHQVLQELGE